MTKGPRYADVKDLKRIAQLEKEEAAARFKLQKQAERDAKIAKKAQLEEQAVLDETAESEAAEALAVEKRKPPTRRDVVPVIVIGKKKPTTEAPMTHGATTDNDFESRIMIKVNNQLESAL